MLSGQGAADGWWGKLPVEFLGHRDNRLAAGESSKRLAAGARLGRMFPCKGKPYKRVRDSLTEGGGAAMRVGVLRRQGYAGQGGAEGINVQGSTVNTQLGADWRETHPCPSVGGDRGTGGRKADTPRRGVGCRRNDAAASRAASAALGLPAGRRAGPARPTLRRVIGRGRRREGFL